MLPGPFFLTGGLRFRPPPPRLRRGYAEALRLEGGQDPQRGRSRGTPCAPRRSRAAPAARQFFFGTTRRYTAAET